MKVLIMGHHNSGCSTLSGYLSRLYPQHRFCSQTYRTADEPAVVPFKDCSSAIILFSLINGLMPGTMAAYNICRKAMLPIIGACLTHKDIFLSRFSNHLYLSETIQTEAVELACSAGCADSSMPIIQVALIDGCEPDLTRFFNAAVSYATKRAATLTPPSQQQS